MRILLSLAYNILRLITWPLWGLGAFLRKRRTRWIDLRVRGRVHELPKPEPPLLSRLIKRVRPGHVSVHEVRALAERLRENRRVEGVLVTLEALEAGWATLQSLHSALGELRAAGKRVVVMLPQGADQRELWVAAAADAVHTTGPSAFSALGPVAARPYLARTLAKLGVEVQVFAEGDFKTAAEPLARDSMSDAEREQLGALLRTIQEAWVEALGTRPVLGEAGARRLLELGPFSPERAQQEGVVDAVHYPDELEKSLGLDQRKPRSHRRYLKDEGRRLFTPISRARKVALVNLSGAIGVGAAGRGITLPGTRELLRQLAENPRVAGVILHIDSPGGSAIASELLHREISRLDARKPVVAWLGDVAASGGYYLAVATRHITAQPTTITGSIGVISARPVTSALFDKLGVRHEVVKLAPYADLYRGPRALDAREAALVQAETHRYYQRFLDAVQAGRKRERAEIQTLAGGRVWSGRDACTHGLVDALGGYREARAALDALLEKEGVRADARPLVFQPAARAELLWTPFDELVSRVGAPQGVVARCSELWALLTTGERVLAYAHTLPEL